VEKIAERQRWSVRHVNMTISFIALGLVNAAVRAASASPAGVMHRRNGVKGRIPGDVRLRNRVISVVPNGTADSALAAADLLDCFNQGRIIFIARGAKKCFYALLRRPELERISKLRIATQL
jgi:hypothetical protein